MVIFREREFIREADMDISLLSYSLFAKYLQF